MSRARPLLLAAVVLAAAAPCAAADAPQRTRAGVAVVDATWHVGASAGQFTDDTGPLGAEGVDPHLHSLKKRISDGVGLRTSTRALVVADTEGDRVAVLSTDLYLPQDLLNRRVATLLAEHDRDVRLGRRPGPATGITAETLAVTASHNHNTPFYSTPGWGTAIFQDVIDVRFFDFMAKRMAEAVVRASARLVPVRMGAVTRTFDEVAGHTYGPKVADDGTPAGQAFDHTARQLSVVRLDDVSDPRRPRPLANWVVFAVHPEFTWGYDLINGDITHAAARMVDRELGTVSVFSQREVGSSGPHKDTRAHPPAARREFEDNGFGQLDRGARLVADGILAARRDIERGTPERSSAFQPFVEDFDVAAVSERFAPPAARPYPGISSCNTAAYFHGDPRLPVLGFPDCFSVGSNTGLSPAFEALAPATGPLHEGLKAAGVPVPDTIGATALTAVEETAAVHLMAFRLGDVVATFCPCEQFTDTALNIESRLDRVAGNLHTGFDWTERRTPAGRDWCVQGADGRWTCADPRAPSKDLAPVDDLAYRRMRAQIHNDARGWETDLATLGGEAEPADPARIKGNFTHEEDPEHGFGLVLSVGMANDYWGYVPEYREQRSHDHYRKALSGLGAHGADFLATRLARMGASLNGGPAVARTPLDRAFAVEGARAQVVADALGVVGGLATAAFDRVLPADGGTPRVVGEPHDLRRFGAAHVSWTGGSNWTDLPEARVERLVDGAWRSYGDTTGDVQLMVTFPRTDELGTFWRGRFAWRWTAAFEAFSSDVAQPSADGVARRSTPRGVYRFVLEGRHRPRAGAAPRPYRLTSREFRVRPWDGLTVEDVRVERGGRVSFAVGPAGRHTFGERTYEVGPVDYPDGYRSPFRFLDGGRRALFTYGSDDPAQHQQYCPRCSFRPWADAGSATRARVTIVRRDGRRIVVEARAAGGRLKTTRRLRRGERAWVGAGAVRDGLGNTNGAPGPAVSR